MLRFKIGRQNRWGRIPPTNMSLRLCIKCCGVIEAAILSPALNTKSAPCLVVMCSMTIFSFGNCATRGRKCRSMNTASRSKISISGAVTSPCICRIIPTSCMASKTACMLSRLVTPEAELVVAPAG